MTTSNKLELAFSQIIDGKDSKGKNEALYLSTRALNNTFSDLDKRQLNTCGELKVGSISEYWTPRIESLNLDQCTVKQLKNIIFGPLFLINVLDILVGKAQQVDKQFFSKDGVEFNLSAVWEDMDKDVLAPFSGFDYLNLEVSSATVYGVLTIKIKLLEPKDTYANLLDLPIATRISYRDDMKHMSYDLPQLDQFFDKIGDFNFTNIQKVVERI